DVGVVVRPLQRLVPVGAFILGSRIPCPLRTFEGLCWRRWWLRELRRRSVLAEAAEEVLEVVDKATQLLGDAGEVANTHHQGSDERGDPGRTGGDQAGDPGGDKGGGPAGRDQPEDGELAQLTQDARDEVPYGVAYPSDQGS